MFQKTRVRLTLLNASVLFVILVALGAGMYLYLRSTIIGEVDQALQGRARLYETQNRTLPMIAGGIGGGRLTVGTAVANVFSRNIEVLIWDRNGTLLRDPVAERYSPELQELLRRTLFKPEVVTVRHDGEIFRVFGVRQEVIRLEQLLPDLYTQESDVVYYQLVSDIGKEMTILNTVLGIILIGIVLGGGISVLAGLYLADRALVPIRSSWEKQQQFVADASHELRTPLAVLQTHTELLLRHPDHTIEQDSREISTILKEIGRMKKLVNGLLTLSQSDADKVELQMKPIHLNRLAEGRLRQFAPLAAMKEIGLSWRLDGESVVNGDEERLQQLLMILLDNAIKYTPAGGRIEVTCRRTGGAVALRVKDSGIGVGAEELPHIFERFYRGDKVRGRSEGGTGLGLAIAKWIVDRHNGKIDAASEPNKGMTITIALPSL